jgi:peptidyl-prolyl cis-trans isomerase D
MTMLDRMRRHKGWLKWSLALVCLAFVVFYIPSFLRWGDQATPTDRIARVDGSDITAGEFRRVYLTQLTAYRGAYGGNVSEQLLKQLGIEQQILQQMVDERAALAEARRQGLSVTDAEVAQRILTMPAFQENGRFFGSERYEQLLRMQRPPMSRAEFEDNLRRSLVIEKLRSALTEWMTVPDSEVDREYKRRNEKVKVELVSFSADKFRDQVKVSDADLEQFFAGRAEQYRIGEKRRMRYLLVDIDALRSQVKVTEREIDRSYNDTYEMYSTPEQVRASHILFKTEGKKDEEVKAKAEQVLKEARAGKDFVELAKKYSEDESNAKQGGDLDYFGRGRMVPEFDDAVFKMEPGTISDPVKTQLGYHIIKLVEKRAASTKPIEEVKPQITDQLTWEKAQARAAEMATAIEKEITKLADLDRVAKERGLKVQDALPFGREEPIVGIGPSPEVAAAAFELNDGQVSGAVRSSRGYVFLTVTGKQAPYVPKLAEVKDRVREDLIKQRAAALATEQARSVGAALKAAADFTKAAKAAGLEVKTTELIARDSAYPDVGVSSEIDQAAFSLQVGAVSEPIQTSTATAIIRLVERKDPTPEEFKADKDRLKSELLDDRQNRFFSAYMMKAKQRMKIEVNRENLQKVIG